MKNSRAFSALFGLFCLAFSAVLGGCENDDSPMLTNSFLLTEHEFSNTTQSNLTVTWNGADTLLRAQFRPWPEDTSRLELALLVEWSINESFYPLGVLLPTLVVDPVPGEGQVTFEGEKTELGHNLAVQGVYDEEADHLDLTVVSQMTAPEWAGREYTFRFGPGSLKLKHTSPHNPDDVAFAGEMLDIIGEQLGRAYEEMKFVFRGDYTYDWLLKPVGGDYQCLSSSKYWLSMQRENFLMLLLTYYGKEGYVSPSLAAVDNVHAAFTNGINAKFTDVRFFSNACSSHRHLSANYTFSTDGQLTLSVNPYTLSALAELAYQVAQIDGVLTEAQLERFRRFVEIFSCENTNGNYDDYTADFRVLHTSSEARDI